MAATRGDTTITFYIDGRGLGTSVRDITALGGCMPSTLCQDEGHRVVMSEG